MKTEKWISVEDRLPKQDVSVLVFTSYAGNEYYHVADYHRGIWSTVDADIVYVTHWQPLPEPPHP